MASSLHSNLNFLAPPNPATSATTKRRYIPIHCGPRSNRGPLVKGRILSIEAIHAIQALKRAHRTTTTSDDPTTLDVHVTKTLSRLLKADLIAAFKELIRQDQCELALRVFSAVRSEYQPELNLYADLVYALGKNGLTKEIDWLVCDMEKVGVIQCDDKGLIRLVKGLIEAERRDSTVRIYGLMKKSGWGSTFDVDEYVAEVLSKGLRRMGEESLADEIDMELSKLSTGFLGKRRV